MVRKIRGKYKSLMNFEFVMVYSKLVLSSEGILFYFNFERSLKIQFKIYEGFENILKWNVPSSFICFGG